MGVVKTAIGLDMDAPAEPPQVHEDPPTPTNAIVDVGKEAAKLPSIFTTTPRPPDHPDTIYISGGTYLHYIFAIAALYFIIVFMITRCRGRLFWAYDQDGTLRAYTMKVSLFYLGMSGLLNISYWYFYKQAEYTEKLCFYPYNHRWFMITIAGCTILFMALRYLAFALASDRHEETTGSTSWSAENPGYKSATSTFQMYGYLIFAVLLLIFFKGLSEKQMETIQLLSICTPVLSPDSLFNKVLFLFTLLVTGNVSAVLIEMVTKRKEIEDFFGASLNTPFVTTTVGTTASMWFSISIFLWYYRDAFAGQYFVFLGFYAFAEASCAVLASYCHSRGRNL